MSEAGRARCGDLGQGTAGIRVKSLWRIGGNGMSLKEFVNALVKDGNADAKEWFQSKAEHKRNK